MLHVCTKCRAVYVAQVAHCEIDGAAVELRNPDEDPLVGQTLDGYRCDGFLGLGPLGRVYRATHLDLGHAHDIQVLSGEILASPTCVEAIRSRVRTATRIAHENVAALIDLKSSSDGQIFVVREPLDGGTLADLLDGSGALPTGRAAAIGRQIAAGLGAIHQLSAVHGHLDPAGVVLQHRPDGEVAKLVDAGLLTAIGAEPALAARLHAAGRALVDPLYAAPETHDGRAAAPASDMYALGVILYRAITGSRPFDAVDVAELQALKNQDPPPMPPTATGLEPLLVRLLDRDPRRRPSDCRTIVAEIDRIGQLDATGPTEPPFTRSSPIHEPIAGPVAGYVTASSSVAPEDAETLPPGAAVMARGDSVPTAAMEPVRVPDQADEETLDDPECEPMLSDSMLKFPKPPAGSEELLTPLNTQELKALEHARNRLTPVSTPAPGASAPSSGGLHAASVGGFTPAIGPDAGDSDLGEADTRAMMAIPKLDNMATSAPAVDTPHIIAAPKPMVPGASIRMPTGHAAQVVSPAPADTLPSGLSTPAPPAAGQMAPEPRSGRRLVVLIILLLAGLTGSVAYRFLRPPANVALGVLELTTKPPGAVVLIDDHPLEVRTPVKATIPAGEHTLEIRLDGHRTVTFGYAVRTNGSTERRHFDLEPAPNN